MYYEYVNYEQVYDEFTNKTKLFFASHTHTVKKWQVFVEHIHRRANHFEENVVIFLLIVIMYVITVIIFISMKYNTVNLKIAFCLFVSNK